MYSGMKQKHIKKMCKLNVEDFEWYQYKDTNYYVCREGYIMSTNFNKKRIISNKPGQDGYVRTIFTINKKGKNIRIHRIVAEQFIPNPFNKPEVNHINGIKSDNRVDNLEWVTGSENIRHAVDTGLRKAAKGDNVNSAKLDDIKVLEIRTKYKPFIYTMKMLSIEYGICEHSIHRIIHKKLWKHI